MSGQWKHSTRRRRLPADWPTRRRHVLDRDGWRCTHTEAGQRCTAPATDVDHVQPGDDHQLDNLTSLCSPHHRAKSSAEGVAAQPQRRRKRPPPKHPGLIDT